MSRNSSEPIVTLTLFRFHTFAAKFWALSMMQRAHQHLQKVQGMTFYKLLGTGSGNGFHWSPDFSVFGLQACWENEAQADLFFNSHPLWKAYQKRTVETYTLKMKTLQSHGKWGGVSPFQAVDTLPADGPVAVITRAKIKLSRLRAFWKQVPSVGHALGDFDDCVLHAGIGEGPLIYQATFSLWTDAESMKSYAYGHSAHKEAIRKTRELKWFEEELFARFYPFASFGSWKGIDPLKEITSLSS